MNEELMDRKINGITGEIIEAYIKIHSKSGPALFESVFEEILHYELTKRGLLSDRQITLPVL